jgi:hypothetical protein
MLIRIGLNPAEHRNLVTECCNGHHRYFLDTYSLTSYETDSFTDDDLRWYEFTEEQWSQVAPHDKAALLTKGCPLNVQAVVDIQTCSIDERLKLEVNTLIGPLSPGHGIRPHNQ